MERRAMRSVLIVLVGLSASAASAFAGPPPPPAPAAVLWYTHPAEKWENALPVGNGRLGAMVFGKTGRGGDPAQRGHLLVGRPVLDDGAGRLQGASRDPAADLRRAAHPRTPAVRPPPDGLPGRAAEVPVARQPRADVPGGAAPGERLPPRSSISTPRSPRRRYEQGGVALHARGLRLARRPGDRRAPDGRRARAGSSFTAQLRGDRNQAHSNYATDYFRMDGDGTDGLVVRGKSADYLGVAGRLRYERAASRRPRRGRRMRGRGRPPRRPQGANAVTLLVAAATSFVSYKDVSADPDARVEAVMRAAVGKTFDAICKAAHVAEHQRLFRRVAIDLAATADSALPTDERLKKFDGANDPALAGAAVPVRPLPADLLVAAGHAAGQPAGDLEQGHESHVGFEVHDQHQHGDELLAGRGGQPRRVRRAAVPDDPGADRPGRGRRARALRRARLGVPPEHRPLARGRARWTARAGAASRPAAPGSRTHLWEHYRFTGDKAFLREYYPVMKGAAEFFLDFLVPHPTHGWLVTNPSTSPENFPLAPGQRPLLRRGDRLDEPGHHARGRLDDRHADPRRPVRATSPRPPAILGVDAELRRPGARGRAAKLAPMQVGKNGDLQEWLDDWGQREKSHRHISNLYGLYPGAPDLARAGRRRWPTPAASSSSSAAFPGNGWSSAWKAASWARLGDGGRRRWRTSPTPCRNYTTDSLFSICSKRHAGGRRRSA